MGQGRFEGGEGSCGARFTTRTHELIWLGPKLGRLSCHAVYRLKTLAEKVAEGGRSADTIVAANRGTVAAEPTECRPYMSPAERWLSLNELDDPVARRAEWFRYYSEKRITHQWLQVHLLAGLTDVERVLEIGAHLGLVTAMLDNAGFEVTTLDRWRPPRAPQRVRHIQADLRDVAAADIAGFDGLLCCEMLEHLPWEEVDGVLAVFRHSAIPHLVLSVPYEGLQVEARLYANAHRAKWNFALKKLKLLRSFRPDLEGDPEGHRWELGYRGRSLAAFERKLRGAGLTIAKRDFTSPCRSVFYLLDNVAG